MDKWLWYFWIYSFWGLIIEGIFARLTRAADHRRRCLLFLPLCPVYGLGMCAVLLLPEVWLQGWRLFFSGALLATAVEYCYHLVCDKLLGVWFWDYRSVRGNLHGRVCLPFSLAWGGLVALAIRWVHPVVAALYARVPPVLTLLCLLIFTADAVCSAAFLFRTHNISAMRHALG